MYIAEYQGINSFLVGSSKILIEHGVTRRTRGYDCVELSYAEETVQVNLVN